MIKLPRRSLLSRCVLAGILGAAATILPDMRPARADVKEVRFVRQLGLGYLQFYVMEDRKLVEKQANAMGLGEVTTTYRPLGNPTAMVDAILSGTADVAGIGLPPFLTMWDKTFNAARVKAAMAMNREPAYLLTRNPSIKSIRDFTEKDRIALPAPKVSVQAIMLEMMAEKTFGIGKHDVLDHLTVGMSHPDGTVVMLGGKSEITSHFTSPPFQNQQLANPEIHKVLSSYDATDGPNTFSVVAMLSSWREQNPQTYQAVFAALHEANEFIAKRPHEAAEIFIRIEHVKLTAAFVENLIKDPEFSYDPAPQNVMKILLFMNRIGRLKNKPASWKDLFFSDVHGLVGS
jgi:NitT/TauT family transport system substrate-binding protein